MSSTHTINHNLESDKYYVVENSTGQTRQINKNGTYIKKFNLQYTGKSSFSQRSAQPDDAYKPLSTEALYKRPEFYIPQPDKFDAYAQLPRTLQDPFYNDERQRPNTTLDSSKRLLESRKRNAHYGIERPISHITGTAKDYLTAKQSGKIEILTMRNDTKQDNFMNDSVKIINHYALQKPNMTLYKPYKGRNKSTSDQKNTISQVELPNVPHQSYYSQQLTDNQVKSLKEYSKKDLNLQSGTLFKAQSYNFTEQYVYNSDQKKSNLETINDQQQTLAMKKKELQSFQMPITKEKLQITSKGRFNVAPKNNVDFYNEDRHIVKILQPDLFVQKENPKKIQQEKERRELAKIKEVQMLAANLKSKA